MSQHDLTIANQGFPAFRSDLNNALQALGSTQSGSSAPSPTFAHQMWIDTSSAPNVLKVRNADNDAWITVGTLNQSSDRFNLAVQEGGTGASTQADARTNLGLGSIATQAASSVSITGGSITGITDLTVADGGTGRSTLTANNVLLGDGTNAVKFVAPGTNGNVLTSNGTTWISSAASTFTLDDTKVPNVTAGTNYFPLTNSESIGSVDVNTLTKIASARVLRTGTYNFRLRIGHTDSVNQLVYSRIYANGSALGTEQSTNQSGAYTTQTHTSISLTRGDIVQLYIRRSTAELVIAASWQAGVDETVGFLPISMASTNDNVSSGLAL